MNQKFLAAALVSAALALGSCSKESQNPAQPSLNDYQQRTALQVIEAASPEYYRELLDAANNSRGPILKYLPGRLELDPNFPNSTALNRCKGTSGVCAVTVIDDRNGQNNLTASLSDIITVASDVNSSSGNDVLILNEPTPIMIEIRGIRNVSVEPDGCTFAFDPL